MERIFLFLMVSCITYGAQTHIDENHASVPVYINVRVEGTPQQLRIVDDKGIQQDAIVINHIVDKNFREDTMQETFYIQKEGGDRKRVNLSDGKVVVSLEREELSLNGNQINALSSEFLVEREEIVTTDNQELLENKITSVIKRDPSIELNEGDEYTGEVSMTVVWKKE